MVFRAAFPCSLFGDFIAGGEMWLLPWPVSVSSVSSCASLHGSGLVVGSWSRKTGI